MVSNVLGIILQELGRTSLIPIPDLTADRNNSCLISLPNDLKIQIELDATETNLLIGCNLGELPPGRYRTDIFREALRSNNEPYPRVGTFAFSTKTNHLMLFDLLRLSEINGEKVSAHLQPFIEKAGTWIAAIKAGELPTQTPSKSPGLSSLFGMH